MAWVGAEVESVLVWTVCGGVDGGGVVECESSSSDGYPNIRKDQMG